MVVKCYVTISLSHPGRVSGPQLHTHIHTHTEEKEES